jgi:hypothetical protein
VLRLQRSRYSNQWQVVDRPGLIVGKQQLDPDDPTWTRGWRVDVKNFLDDDLFGWLNDMGLRDLIFPTRRELLEALASVIDTAPEEQFTPSHVTLIPFPGGYTTENRRFVITKAEGCQWLIRDRAATVSTIRARSLRLAAQSLNTTIATAPFTP